MLANDKLAVALLDNLLQRTVLKLKAVTGGLENVEDQDDEAAQRTIAARPAEGATLRRLPTSSPPASHDTDPTTCALTTNFAEPRRSPCHTPVQAFTRRNTARAL